MKVLVIENERAIRELLREVLELEGHEVFQAETCGAGLSLVDRESVDLVLTEIGSVGTADWEVAARVKARRPGVKVGLVTSWGRHLASCDLAAHEVDFLLLKPFAIRELRSLLARLEPA